jgi:hypothetical protein
LHPRFRLAIPCALTLLGVLAAEPARSDDPNSAPSQTPTPPIHVIVETPADFETLLKRLTQPDFVVESGAHYEQRRTTAGPSLPSPLVAVVEAVSARGEVFDELAHLSIEASISLATAGPSKVALGLDGLTVIEADEADRGVPISATPDGGWQVELRGTGRHMIRIKALGRIKPGSEGPRLEFGIPQVASTSIDLTVGPGVRTAFSGTREPIAAEPIQGGQRTRLVAHLSPRKRIDITWLIEADARAQGPLQLEARGEIALNIDPGSLQARSSWLIQCDQGTTRSLALKVDSADELLGVELNDRPLPTEGQRDPMTGVVTIPLPEALRPGRSQRLVVSTRRVLPAGSTRVLYQGTPIDSTTSQAGVVAIARTGDLAVVGSGARALRQIDPRNDLPQGLRARPTTVLAFQFFAQPLDLELRIDPAPPRLRVDSRATVSVEPKSARVDARLDYHVSGGRVFEVQVGVPDGLEWETAGPEGVVASTQLLPGSTTDSDMGSRVLMITLSSKARDAGTFSISLTGRQPIDASRHVHVGMFRPRQAVCRGVRVAVLSARNVDVELGESSRYTVSTSTPPTDWPWPEDRVAGSTPSALWLRDDGNPSEIPLKLAVRPRVLRSETTVTVRVDRRAIDAKQDTVCRIQHGSLSQLDVAVPVALDPFWEIDGADVASRRKLVDGSKGEARYRLVLAREATDVARLRFRFRLPLINPLVPERPMTVELPWIRILEATGASPRFELATEPGVRVEPKGNGWDRPVFDDSAASRDRGSAIDWIRSSGAGDDGPAILSVTASALADMPALVASRLWLRTTQGADGEIRTSAWYRVESYGAEFSFALPTGSRLDRAWVGYDIVTRPERGPQRDTYRLSLPLENESSFALVGFEYVTTTAAYSSRGSPPRLLDGGRVQRTFWLVRVPWNNAVWGVPSGWTDENEWYWSLYLWMRRPLRGGASLASWVAGPTLAARMGEATEPPARSGEHEYLFSRSGDPATLSVSVWSRPLLVGIFSGGALAAGLILLRWPLPTKIWIPSAAALVFVTFVAIDSNVVLLAAQSSVVGLMLVLVAAVTEWLVERRRRPASLFSESATRSSSSGSGRVATAEVGSDDSTVIRSRAASTAEHIRSERSSDVAGGLVQEPETSAPRV